MANQQPDTRVRLSAEGVEEVIAAYRKIQAEAAKTGKAGAQGFDAMSAAGKQLAAILPTISIAAAIAGTALFAKRAADMVQSSIDLADSLGKLSQKTGIATETLSVFSFAARTADVEQGQLEQSLRVFQKTMGAYTSGAQDAADATEQLFNDRKALQGLNDDQRLLKVVDALAKLEPGAKRASLAIKFFGRSGTDLLPLIDDLGNGGFDKLGEKAQKLGLVIDGDLAAAAQRANDAMTDLHSAVEGVTIQFASGFTPALAEAAEALVETLSGNGQDAFRELGATAGSILKDMGTAMFTLGAEWKAMFREITSIIVNTGRFIGAPQLGIKKTFGVMVEEIAEIENQLARQRNDLVANLTKAEARSRTPREKRTRGGDELAEINDTKKLGKQRLSLEEALIDQELALQRAGLALRTEAERQAFEEGLVGIRESFGKRRLLIEADTDAEVSALRRRAELVANAPAEDEAAKLEKEKSLAEIRGKIQLAELKLRGDLLKLTAEERKAIDDKAKADKEAAEAREKQIADQIAAEDQQVEQQFEAGRRAFLERRKFETELLELEGKRHEAALRNIDDEADARAFALNQQGLQSKEIVEQVEAFRRAKQSELARQEESERTAIALRLVEAQNRRHEAALLQIQQEADEVRQQLLANTSDASGVSPDVRAGEIEGIVDLFVRAREAALRFSEASEKTDDVLRSIDVRRREIQQQVADGTLFPFQAEERILDMERERLPLLRNIAREASAAAEATGDPQAVERARELTLAVRDLEIQTDAAAQRAAQLKASFQSATEGALENFFTTGIDQAHSFGDAMRSLALDVVQSLRRMAAQMLATLITQKLLSAAVGAFGGPIGGSASAGAPAGASFLAGGGLIQGPGTGTSDSILARLSDGEFVVREAVVRQPGMLEHLRYLNSPTLRWTPRPAGGVPRFAEGGLVGEPGSAGGRSELGIELSDGLIVSKFSSKQFERAVIRTLNRHRNAVNGVLGGR